MIVLNGAISNYAIVNGKKYSYFGGNNYLGLANHPSVKVAAIQAVEKYGVNFAASRRTTGTADIHLELEKQLALFKGKEDAVVFASGYQGNSILLEILRDRYSVVFADRSAHASIIAAIPGEGVKVVFYNHCDHHDLEKLLDLHKEASPLVITDGIFALTGEIAPLDSIYPVVKKHNGILVVDDAHATGILGNTGKGTPEHFNLPDDESIFQTETMSKALGGYGGFISGNKALTGLIREKSATYQASTSLPPPIVAAGLASLEVIRKNPAMRLDLLGKARQLRGEIAGMGFNTTDYDTPIIPIILPSCEKAKSLSLFLEENGIIVPFINYPGMQEMNIVRITVSAIHTNDQISLLLKILKQHIEEYGKD